MKPKNKVEKCGGCNKPCNPLFFIGWNRIPICSNCADLIDKNDVEWAENITKENLRDIITKLKKGRK